MAKEIKVGDKIELLNGIGIIESIMVCRENKNFYTLNYHNTWSTNCLGTDEVYLVE
jgi:hypothetical protein